MNHKPFSLTQTGWTKVSVAKAFWITFARIKANHETSDKKVIINKLNWFDVIYPN